MDEKTTFKKLVEHQYELNNKNHTVLQEIAGISRSLLEVSKEMKDINKTVSDSLQKNTEGLLALEKFWGRVVMFLIGVLALLAGARGVGDVIKGL